MARGFNESPATKTNRDPRTGKPQSDDGVNGHLADPKPATGNDGTPAERTLRSHVHPDENAKTLTPRQRFKSVAAELPSCEKTPLKTSSDDHSLNAAGNDQGTAMNDSTIRGQDDSTGQSSRPNSNKASADYSTIYSEQASLRLRQSGRGPRIILNWQTAGVPIILNGPFLICFLWACWGIYIP